MKRIRKSRAARVLSWLLTVVMILPLLTQALRPQAARAQGASNVQTVIVVDFVNKSNVLGNALARLATDAVAVEMTNSARFEILKRDEVLRTANELGLRPPFDQVALARIANALGATAVVTGEIAYAKEVRGANPKTIRVGLKVRVQEASSGDLINGAAQIGEARAKPGVSDTESLAQEAVRDAGFLAVRQILANNLPEGTVIQSTGGDVTGSVVIINKGERDGLAEGQQMIVLRGRQRVGRIQLTRVFQTNSEANVLENTLGISPEDKVRANFPMPDFNERTGELVTPRRAGTNNAIGTLGKVLVVLLVGIVIVAAVSGGNQSVTGVTAEADIQNGAPAVRMIWRDNIFGQNTIEYHIWRSPDASFNFQGIPVGAVGNGERTFTDFPAPGSYWDGVRGFRRPNTDNGGGGGGGGGGNGLAEVVTPAAGAVLGFVIGRTYTYQVDAVVRRPVPQANTGGGGGGGGGTGDLFEDILTKLVTSGPTTPINQPLLGPAPADQAANVNLASFNPTWFSRQGADEFVLEVSTDRTFSNRSLIQQFPVFSTAPNADGVTQSLSAPVDLRNSGALRRDPTFLNFVNGVSGAPKPTIYWRVGARNSADRPGPVHWITRDPKDNDRTFRYIYSQSRSFTPADIPPPPP